jgi:hypothetical protein
MSPRWFAIGCLALVGGAFFAGRAARGEAMVALPGPAPRPHGLPVDGLGKMSNASCEGCHPDIAAEWRRSLHHQAWVDPVFQQAYQVEPLGFCRGCHAPESDPENEPTAAAGKLGIGCTTCHVESGHVVGVKENPGALHPVFADARLATSAACGGCHQFDFPEGAHQKFPEPMQDTVREHAHSDAAGAECQSCHMPVVDGSEGRHHRHDFTVLGDPAMVKSAAKVSAERVDGESIAITLAPAQAGHAFPTGDMFRKLELRAVAVDKNGKTLASARPVALARTFRDVARDPLSADLTFQRVSASDTRVPPPGSAPRRVVIPLPPEAATATVRWQVVYQRMSSPMAEAFHVNQVLDEIVVAEGSLAPPALARAQPETGGLR